jgi:hypothetical protein
MAIDKNHPFLNDLRVGDHPELGQFKMFRTNKFIVKELAGDAVVLHVISHTALRAEFITEDLRGANMVRHGGTGPYRMLTPEENEEIVRFYRQFTAPTSPSSPLARDLKDYVNRSTSSASELDIVRVYRSVRTDASRTGQLAELNTGIRSMPVEPFHHYGPGIYTAKDLLLQGFGSFYMRISVRPDAKAVVLHPDFYSEFQANIKAMGSVKFRPELLRRFLRENDIDIIFISDLGYANIINPSVVVAAEPIEAVLTSPL